MGGEGLPKAINALGLFPVTLLANPSLPTLCLLELRTFPPPSYGYLLVLWEPSDISRPYTNSFSSLQAELIFPWWSEVSPRFQ